MDIFIIIPCYNEDQFLEKNLSSLVNQTLKAKNILIVNDNSTDGSEEIINAFAKAHKEISTIKTQQESQHLPGSKVINAFNTGLNRIDGHYDIICKFDADLIFPLNYLEEITKIFTQNPKAGMVGGFCHIKKGDDWELENLTNNDHIRGALKAYRKDCFKDIQGLKPAMGWDTVDELLAKYHKWEIVTLNHLVVKHLKPTGNTYTQAAQYKQGEAFYSLRYGFTLSLIASLKLAFKKKKITLFWDYMRGYFRAKRNKKQQLVTAIQGKFIRKLRWQGIKAKILNS
jgi:glycosyltransferase involved in cell wall biosynthesis